MTVATVMVYVDPAQQAEEQVRVARSLVTKFDSSMIGVSAFAVEPSFVAEGVIIQETTPQDLKPMKTALAEKEKWFRDIVGRRRSRGLLPHGPMLGSAYSHRLRHVPRQSGTGRRECRVIQLRPFRDRLCAPDPRWII